MKICFFSIVTYWHGMRGGMDIHGKLLLEGLEDRGHEITVISTHHPAGISRENKGNIRLHYLPRTNFGTARKGWRKESKKAFGALNEIEKFDVICSQQPIFPSISKTVRSRVPLITLIQAHEGWVMLSEINQFLSLKKDLKGLIKNMLSFLYHYSSWEFFNFQSSDVIVTPAHEVSRSLRRWFFIKENKIKTVYNGVDTRRFKPDDSARKRIVEKYPQISGKRVVLFMSHVTRQKGLHLLLKVLPSLVRHDGDLVLMVVGGGNYLEEAKTLSRRLGVADRIVFSGMVDNSLIPDFINTADIFVLPTLRREGLPLSILEVMACKKPVIATNIGGNSSVVEDGINGVLIPPKDTNSLEDKIRLLLNDSEMAERLAENGYKTIQERFSLDKMLDDFESLMEKQIELMAL